MTSGTNFTIVPSDDVFLVAGTCTATFPLAAAVAAGKSYLFIAAAATTMTFAAAGSDTFPVGLAVVNAAGEVGEFISDGVSKWYTARGLIA